jgi:hypothetical protein
VAISWSFAEQILYIGIEVFVWTAAGVLSEERQDPEMTFGAT